jgi:hypothetical protein
MHGKMLIDFIFTIFRSYVISYPRSGSVAKREELNVSWYEIIINSRM